MLNIELLSVSDRVAAANLERRRTRELQRQKTIFNAKVRTIGIDREALERQVNENKQKAQEEEESLNNYASIMLRDDRAAHLLASRQATEDRVMNKAVVDFRQHFQQPQCRREYDLNDPEHLRKTDGKFFGHGFAGEDLGCQDRLRRQQEQQREWSIQQQHEQAVARKEQRLEDQQYEHSRLDLDNWALQIQNVEEEKRKAVAFTTRDYNLAMATENRERRRQESSQEAEDKRMDILNSLQRGLLTEASDPTLGMLGAPRLRTARERQEVVQFQKFQAEERKRMELERKQAEQRQDADSVTRARSALLLEREQDTLTRQRRQDLDQSNARVAQAQNHEKAREKGYSYVETFSSGFNTSSR